MLSYGPSDQAILWPGSRAALSLPWAANNLTDRKLSRHATTAGVCRLQDINQERRLVEQCDERTARRRRRRSEKSRGLGSRHGARSRLELGVLRRSDARAGHATRGPAS